MRPQAPLLGSNPAQTSELELLAREITRRYGLRPHASWPRTLAHAVEQLLLGRRLDPARARVIPLQQPELVRELAGRLTVEETYFFRFPEQIQVAVSALREAWLRRRQPVLAWSAGCSTGEEPYSVAMGVHEALGPSAGQVRMLACDLSSEAIARARAGVYGSWSFRGVGAPIQSTCFDPVGDRLRIRECYRQAVHFEHLSIEEMAESLVDESVEVILFRNVGVYLDEDALRRCHATFRRVLTRSGILIQAATDPSPLPGHFVRSEGDPVGVFRHAEVPLAGGACPRVPGAPLAASGTFALAESVAGPLRRSASAKKVDSRAAAPLALPPSLRPPPEVEAVRHGDRGDIARALQAADRAIEQRPHDIGGFILRGQLQLAADAWQAAADDLRRALFIAPHHCLARYWYIVALHAGGQRSRVRSQVRELERQLASVADESNLEDGTTTVRELREALATLGGLYD